MKVYLWEHAEEVGGAERRTLLGAFSTLARALAEAGGVNGTPLSGPKVSAVMGQHYWERELRPWGADNGLTFIVTEVEVEQ